MKHETENRKQGTMLLNKMLHDSCFMIPDQKGAAAFPTVVVIASIMLLAGIGIVGTGFVEDAVTFGEKESREALYAAETGAHDAFERLVRNKDCNNGGTPSCSSYSFPVGDASVSVLVSGAASPKTITATGTRKNKTRKIQVIVTLNTDNKIAVSGWAEVVD